MRRLHRRLAKLENAVQKRKQQPSSEEVAQAGEQWETFVRQLLPTMKEEHHWILDAFLADWNSRDHDQAILPKGLMDAIIHMLSWVGQGEPRQVGLPPDVVEAYLAGTAFSWSHDCERCGYMPPQGWCMCPLCGGYVGWSAFSVRINRDIQARQEKMIEGEKSSESSSRIKTA